MPKLEQEYGFGSSIVSETSDTVYPEGNQEKIILTKAALVQIINSYCGHEAGVRNLRKCLDRIFRKLVAKIEGKKMIDSP
jgi:ATP-dependent Lon protease